MHSFLVNVSDLPFTDPLIGRQRKPSGCINQSSFVHSYAVMHICSFLIGTEQIPVNVSTGSDAKFSRSLDWLGIVYCIHQVACLANHSTNPRFLARVSTPGGPRDPPLPGR